MARMATTACFAKKVALWFEREGVERVADPVRLRQMNMAIALAASRWLRDRYDADRFVSGALLVALGLLLFFDRFWWIRIAFNRLFEKFGVDV